MARIKRIIVELEDNSIFDKEPQQLDIIANYEADYPYCTIKTNNWHLAGESITEISDNVFDEAMKLYFSLENKV